jgi:hypothetical protein
MNIGVRTFCRFIRFLLLPPLPEQSPPVADFIFSLCFDCAFRIPRGNRR